MRVATRMDLWHSDRCRGTRTGAVSLGHGMFGAEESPRAVVGAGPAAGGPGAAVDRDVRAGDVARHGRAEEDRHVAAFLGAALTAQRHVLGELLRAGPSEVGQWVRYGALAVPAVARGAGPVR